MAESTYYVTRDWSKEAKSRTRFSAALLSSRRDGRALVHAPAPSGSGGNLRVTRGDERGSGEVERGKARERFINESERARHSARSKELHFIVRSFLIVLHGSARSEKNMPRE